MHLEIRHFLNETDKILQWITYIKINLIKSHLSKLSIIRKEVRLKLLLEISDLMSFSEGMTPKGYPYDSDSSTQDSFTVSPHQMGIFI